MGESRTIRVAVLGYGAIGARVSKSLDSGEVAGAILAGIITSSPERAASRGYRVITVHEALTDCDLVVECATGARLRSLGPKLIQGGVDLLPASLGALAEPNLRKAIMEAGPGRCYLTAGAIGGLDILGAAAANHGLDSVSLTSTKLASTLVQPWMSHEQAERLRNTDKPFALFDGSVQEAIKLFPASLNVGVAIAAATGMWEEVRVQLVADPRAILTNHRIRASGSSGSTTSRLPTSRSPTPPLQAPWSLPHYFEASAALRGHLAHLYDAHLTQTVQPLSDYRNGLRAYYRVCGNRARNVSMPC